MAEVEKPQPPGTGPCDMSALAQPPIALKTDHQLLSFIGDTLVVAHKLNFSFDDRGFHATWWDAQEVQYHATGPTIHDLLYAIEKEMLKATKEK